MSSEALAKLREAVEKLPAGRMVEGYDALMVLRKVRFGDVEFPKDIGASNVEFLRNVDQLIYEARRLVDAAEREDGDGTT